jgi:hypothetical protein
VDNGKLDRVEVQGAKLSDAPVEYLANVSAQIRQYIREENDDALHGVLALVDQKPALFSRLLPTPLEKEQRRVAGEQVRQIADDKRKMVELYTHFQLEIARREGEVLIAARSVETGGVLTAFATQKLLELTDTIADAQEKFMDKYGPRQDEIDKYKTTRPELYERAAKSQRHQLEIYFNTTDALLNDFQASLEKRLARQSDVRR